MVEDGIKATEEEANTWLLTANNDVENYLRGISAERLAGLMGNAAIRMKAFPHLYIDGTVIPKSGFKTKSYNDVPLMLVTGTDEFSLFAASDELTFLKILQVVNYLQIKKNLLSLPTVKNMEDNFIA